MITSICKLRNGSLTSMWRWCDCEMTEWYVYRISPMLHVTIIFWLWTWSKVWPSGLLRILKQVHFQFLINPCNWTRLVKEVETMPEVGREVMSAALCSYTIHCLSGVKSHHTSTQSFLSSSLTLNFLPIPVNKHLYTLFFKYALWMCFCSNVSTCFVHTTTIVP